MRARSRNSAPAYRLVDISSLPDDVRAEILEDAMSGGRDTGVRVVEEAINGGARAAIFGVYHDVTDANGNVLSDDATRWDAYKKEVGIDSDEVDDSTVTSVAEADQRREAALRQQAIEKANSDADRMRTAEENDLSEITGEKSTATHSQNIVDDGVEAAKVKTSKAPK